MEHRAHDPQSKISGSEPEQREGFAKSLARLRPSTVVTGPLPGASSCCTPARALCEDERERVLETFPRRASSTARRPTSRRLTKGSGTHDVSDSGRERAGARTTKSAHSPQLHRAGRDRTERNLVVGHHAPSGTETLDGTCCSLQPICGGWMVAPRLIELHRVRAGRPRGAFRSVTAVRPDGARPPRPLEASRHRTCRAPRSIRPLPCLPGQPNPASSPQSEVRHCLPAFAPDVSPATTQ